MVVLIFKKGNFNIKSYNLLQISGTFTIIIVLVPIYAIYYKKIYNCRTFFYKKQLSYFVLYNHPIIPYIDSPISIALILRKYSINCNLHLNRNC